MSHNDQSYVTTTPVPLLAPPRLVQATLTPASVGAATVAEQTFTVPGIAPTDVLVAVNPPAIGNATGLAGWRVTAQDTIGLRFVNPTAGALTPSSGVFKLVVVKGV